MRTLTIFGIGLFTAILVSSAGAQVSCFQYGQFVSCDGPRGQHTDQLQLSPSQGVVTDDRGNLEPYAIFPSPSRPSQPLHDVLPKSRAPRTLSSPGSLFLDDSSSVLEPSGPIFMPMYGGDVSQ